MQDYIVLVGSYDVTKVKDVQGRFSKEVKELLKQGWQFSGELQTHTDIVKRHGQLSIYVTMIREFVREISQPIVEENV